MVVRLESCCLLGFVLEAACVRNLVEDYLKRGLVSLLPISRGELHIKCIIAYLLIYLFLIL